MNDQADPENDQSSNQNTPPKSDKRTSPLRDSRIIRETRRIQQPSVNKSSNFSDDLNRFADELVRGLDKLFKIISVEGKKLIEEVNNSLSQPPAKKKTEGGNIQEGLGENGIQASVSQDISEFASETMAKQKNKKELWKPPPSANQYDLKSPGYFLDGWADLIEDMGDNVKDVRKDVFKILLDREMPSWIHTQEVNAHVGLVSSGRRQYLINKTSPGAITTIDIRKHGKDLYVSWRTFIKPVLNWALIIVMIIAAIGLASFSEAMYVESSGLYAREFSVNRVFVISLIILTILALLILISGRIVKGDLFAYFFVEPNLFDAEDITAMSLSAHKSILRALDLIGIDVSKLRLKQTFKGGRRGEAV